jgi:heat shock protein HslJ
MKITLPVLALGAVALLVGGCASSSDPMPSAASTSPPAFPLAGPSWQLVELNGKPVPAAEGLPAPTLQLDATSRRASGTGGVNRYTASYELNGLALRFGNAASTKKAGRSDAMAIEDAYFKALATVSAWSITGDQLELKSAEKIVLLFKGQ